RYRNRVQADGGLLMVLGIALTAHFVENRQELVDASQPAARGGNQGPSRVFGSDDLRRPVREYHSSARRRVSGRTIAHVSHQAYGVGGFLERDVDRFVRVK